MAQAAWQGAVAEADGCAILRLTVSPGARVARFPDGWDAWRGRIGCRVTEPAQDGKANTAVCAAVAAFFGMAPGAVSVVAGVKARQKSVRVEGLSGARATASLAVVLS